MSDYGGKNEALVNDNILFVSALEIETQGKMDDYDVLYTGVGKVNATFALTRKFGKLGSFIPYSCVVNYGTAGSRKIKKGKLVDCTRFIQRDMDVTGLGFQRGETPFEEDPPLILDFLDKNPQNTELSNLRALCFNCVYELAPLKNGWYRHRETPIGRALDEAEPGEPPIEIPKDDKLSYIPFEEFQKML